MTCSCIPPVAAPSGLAALRRNQHTAGRGSSLRGLNDRVDELERLLQIRPEAMWYWQFLLLRLQEWCCGC